jgi:hypothetical protein
MNAVVVDTTPSEGKQGWKWRVHHAIASLFVAVGLMGAAMVTGLPLVGQVAWANGVDQKIAAAVKPIEDKVGTLEKAVTDQNAISKAFLARMAEDAIVDTFQRMCRETQYSLEWRKLNSDYVRFRADYARAAGREYVELRCPVPG